MTFSIFWLKCLFVVSVGLINNNFKFKIGVEECDGLEHMKFESLNSNKNAMVRVV